MGKTTTTNLSLIKEDGDEKVADHISVASGNLDIIDAAIASKLDASKYRGRQTWGDLKGRDTWGSLTGADETPSGTDTSTENLSLTKIGYDSTVDVATINANMDSIDAQIQSLKDVIANAKTLLGQLGLDENGNPLIDAAAARSTLGITPANIGAATSSEVQTLRDSVSPSVFDFRVKNHAYANNISFTEAMRRTLNDMESGRHTLELGTCYANGYHTYIAFRYGGSDQYGCILSFDPWGNAYLGYLTDGTYTVKKIALS